MKRFSGLKIFLIFLVIVLSTLNTSYSQHLSSRAIQSLEELLDVYGKTSIRGLGDVSDTAPLDNQIPKWDAATQQFEFEADAGGTGSPGGSNTQVQFNDSAAFGGDAGLTYIKGSALLSVTNLDVTGLTANRIPFTNSAGTQLADSANFTYNGTRLVVGTASPVATALHIVNEGGSSMVFLDGYGASVPVIAGRRAAGTISTPTAVTNGTTLSALEGRGYDGSSFSSSQAKINIVANENWSATNHGSYISFNTTPNESTTQSEACRITNKGQLLFPGINWGAAETAYSRIGITTNCMDEYTGSISVFTTDDPDSTNSGCSIWSSYVVQGGMTSGYNTGIVSNVLCNNLQANAALSWWGICKSPGVAYSGQITGMEQNVVQGFYDETAPRYIRNSAAHPTSCMVLAPEQHDYGAGSIKYHCDYGLVVGSGYSPKPKFFFPIYVQDGATAKDGACIYVGGAKDSRFGAGAETGIDPAWAMEFWGKFDRGIDFKNAAINNADGTLLRLANNRWINAINAAGSANVNIVKVNASDLIEFGAGFRASATLLAATGNEIAYKLDYTTNKATSGNDTGLLISMTDTASPGTSLLQDWQVGGVSRANLNASGGGMVFNMVDALFGATFQGDTYSAVGANLGSAFLGRRARGDIASPVKVNLGDTMLTFGGWGMDTDGGVFRQGAQIEFVVDGTPGASDMPGRIVFLTTPDGTSNPTEKMRITNAGSVGIGTATPNANAKLDIVGQYFSERYSIGNSGATLTVNFANGNVQHTTLTENCTLSVSNGMNGGRYILFLKQDGDGNKTVTWWSGILWAGGNIPTLTGTGGKTDIITFVYDGTNWFGSYSLNY